MIVVRVLNKILAYRKGIDNFRFGSKFWGCLVFFLNYKCILVLIIYILSFF